jgi:hypothetical protein
MTKMTKNEIIQALAKLHTPEAREQHMVYQVWEDGEVTLQKGGELFGLRHLHMVDLPCAFNNDWIPVPAMPELNRDSSHGFLFAKDAEAVVEARGLIRAYREAV